MYFVLLSYRFVSAFIVDVDDNIGRTFKTI